MSDKLGVFHIAIKSGSGTEVFTQHLHNKLLENGILSEIFWLPPYAEFMPWLVKRPVVPSWVSVICVNTRTHPRFSSYNIPVVSTFHSSIYDASLLKYKAYIKYFYHILWIKMCEKKTVFNSVKITAVSNYTAQQAKISFNLKSVDVIYNSVDTNLFSPGGNNRKKKSVIDILFVGRPTLLKGFDVLLSIARQLGNGYRVNVTASRECFNGSMELPENINLVGRVTDRYDLVRLYQNSDIFLSTSRLEGLSLALLEAQACGLPCVVSNSSSMPEVVKDGVNGFLCDLNSVNSFVVALTKLGYDFELREKMGKCARKNVLENFSEDAMIKRYISLYSLVSNIK